MENNNTYYDLILELIRSHNKYPKVQEFEKDIAEDVYKRAKIILDTLDDNNEIISAYLKKVVSVSIVTVPHDIKRNKRTSDNTAHTELPNNENNTSEPIIDVHNKEYPLEESKSAELNVTIQEESIQDLQNTPTIDSECDDVKQESDILDEIDLSAETEPVLESENGAENTITNDLTEESSVSSDESNPIILDDINNTMTVELSDKIINSITKEDLVKDTDDNGAPSEDAVSDLITNTADAFETFEMTEPSIDSENALEQKEIPELLMNNTDPFETFEMPEPSIDTENNFGPEEVSIEESNEETVDIVTDITELPTELEEPTLLINNSSIQEEEFIEPADSELLQEFISEDVVSTDMLENYTTITDEDSLLSNSTNMPFSELEIAEDTDVLQEEIDDYSSEEISEITTNIDENKIQNALCELDREFPALYIMKVFDYKYKQKKSVKEVADIISTSDELVTDALCKIVNIIEE